MKKIKMPLICVAAVIAVIIMAYFGIQHASNTAIDLEESVYTAQSDIKVQEKTRVDLVYNLADCVKQYDAYEGETITKLADNMSTESNIENVTTSISGIAYSYPELKSSANYKQLMTELAKTENLMAQYRENYNSQVKIYNAYVKKFPARLFLSLTGYDVQNFERLDYDAPSDAPQNLFEDK